MAATVTATLKAAMNTVSTIAEFNARGSRYYIGSLAFDGTYASGGVSLSFPFTPDIVNISPCSGYIFEYDYTNEKVKILYADYDAVADGALIEIADDTDVSVFTDVRVEAKKAGA